MGIDFVPKKDEERRQWLTNLKKSITEQGHHYNLSPTDISRAGQLCDEYSAQIYAAYQAKINSKTQVAAKKSMTKTHLRPLRKIINMMKAADNFNQPAGVGMKVISHKQELDAATYKPKLRGRFTGDLVEVKFKKLGIDGMEFRVKEGEKFNVGEWKNAGLRLYSPFYYKPEGYSPGEVVTCWVMAVAMKKDKQFGQWSNPIKVLYEVPL